MVPLLAEVRDETSIFDGRRALRRTLHLRVRTSASSGRATAQIHTLSENGMLVETSTQFTLGETLHVDLPRLGLTPAVVIWNRGDHYGCEFIEWIPTSVVSAAVL